MSQRSEYDRLRWMTYTRECGHVNLPDVPALRSAFPTIDFGELVESGAPCGCKLLATYPHRFEDVRWAA